MLHGEIHHPAEFDIAIAIAAGVRCARPRKVVVTASEHAFRKGVVAYGYVMLDAQPLCNGAGAQDAFVFFGIVGRPVIRKRRQHAERDSENVVALLQKQERRHRRVDAATHSYCYTFLRHASLSLLDCFACNDVCINQSGA